MVRDMNVRVVICAIIIAVALSAGCKPKADSVAISELQVITDSIRYFSVKMPTNWNIQRSNGELIVATTTKSDASRFSSFGPGEGGGKIEFRVVPVDSLRNMDTLVKNSKVEFENPLETSRYKLSSATMAGKPAKKLTVAFDQTDGEFKQEQYFVENDSLITILQFATFGGTWDDYKSEFEEILQSVKLPKRIVAAPKPVADTSKTPGVPEPPSETFRVFAAPNFSISIPDNFTGTKGSGTGISSMNFAGSRLDCTIQVDVFNSNKQSLEKIIEQNKARYNGASPQQSKLSGERAMFFAYNPVANVSSRAYFAVKGDRMIRVTINWFKPEQAVYLPLFEKSLASLSLK
jgi:hypothetical protein